MQCDETIQASVLILSPRGAIAGGDGSVLKSRMSQAAKTHRGRVVLDLIHVPYLDSDGLEALADLSGELEKAARSLKVSGANETLREVLDLTEVAAGCELFDDVSAAVRSFA